MCRVATVQHIYMVVFSIYVTFGYFINYYWLIYQFEYITSDDNGNVVVT